MIAKARKLARVRTVDWKKKFEQLLPAIQRAAHYAFRKLPPAERDEAVCEVVANAFCAFRRLVDLGKMDLAYASPLAQYAIAQYRSGRRVGASLCKRDVLGSADRDHGRHYVVSMDRRLDGSNWPAELADGRYWSVADQAAFRIDFPAWLRSLKRRDRRLAKYLSFGNRTTDAANRFGMTAGRISQLRSEMESAWDAFHSLPTD